MKNDRDLVTNGWNLQNTYKKQVLKFSGIEVNAKFRIYAHKDTVKDGEEKYFGCFVFISKLDFSPTMSETQLDYIRKIVNIKFRHKFPEILDEKGVDNIQYISSSSSTVNSLKLKEYNYRGEMYMFGSQQEIKSQCTVFHTGSNYFVVGYARPKKELSDIIDSKEEIEVNCEKRVKNIISDISDSS